MRRWLLVREPYDVAYFATEEVATAEAFKLAKRRDEWLLARYAAKRLALELGIVDDPRACRVARPMLVVSESAAHLFLKDDETAAMQRCAIEHRLLHFWCAKEAAWKQRSDELEERADGLLFDCVETMRIDDAIVAVTV